PRTVSPRAGSLVEKVVTSTVTLPMTATPVRALFMGPSSPSSVAGAVGGDSIAVRAGRRAVATGSVAGEVKGDSRAGVVFADRDSGAFLCANDVDECHRRLGEDAFGEGAVVRDGMQVPVGVVVPYESGVEGHVLQSAVDGIDHLVARCEQHHTQSRSKLTHRRHLCGIAVNPAC